MPDGGDTEGGMARQFVKDDQGIPAAERTTEFSNTVANRLGAVSNLAKRDGKDMVGTEPPPFPIPKVDQILLRKFPGRVRANLYQTRAQRANDERDTRPSRPITTIDEIDTLARSYEHWADVREFLKKEERLDDAQCDQRIQGVKKYMQDFITASAPFGQCTDELGSKQGEPLTEEVINYIAAFREEGKEMGYDVSAVGRLEIRGSDEEEILFAIKPLDTTKEY